MCVVSMISDHYWDKWKDRTVPMPTPNVFPYVPEPAITDAEIKEFRELLERAREYDKKNNQPDCELQEKKDKLLKLAEQLGVKIDFL